MKPLVFCREVLGEVLMLAAVQEHVQSAAFVLHQVGRFAASIPLCVLFYGKGHSKYLALSGYTGIQGPRNTHGSEAGFDQDRSVYTFGWFGLK